MKISKAKVEEAIAQRCLDLGLKPGSTNGHYAISTKENLLSGLKGWKTIEAELNKGQGNELNPKTGLPKFNAFHSSSALGVNNFSAFKYELKKFEFLGYKDFEKTCFEKKLPTGISTPNLDFYTENKDSILGFESKFTEILEPKLPNKLRKRDSGEIIGNLSAYKNKFSKLDNVSNSFISVIEEYISEEEKLYLDAAQLIKHSIGLLNKGKMEGKDPVLVYIYWLPTNWYVFELYRQHEIEITMFKNVISKYLKFIPISYLDFWSLYENNSTFSNHIKRVRNRYELSIKI